MSVCKRKRKEAGVDTGANVSPPASTDSLFTSVPSRLPFGESFTEDERVLHELLKVHPILSLNVANEKPLRATATLMDLYATRLPDIPVVKKSHDDLFLRPPRVAIGERPCVSADACMCSIMARIRHGADTDMAFVGVEFLDPREYADFNASGRLPITHGRCLVCTRYWNTYVYIRARTDPSFRLDHCVPLREEGTPQFTDASRPMCALHEGRFPASCSVVDAPDGYKSHAMLFADEGFAEASRLAREAPTVAFMWRPIVRFCSSHYTYVATDGVPSIVQVGIGTDVEVGTAIDRTHFGQPPSDRVGPTAANSSPASASRRPHDQPPPIGTTLASWTRCAD